MSKTYCIGSEPGDWQGNRNCHEQTRRHFQLYPNRKNLSRPRRNGKSHGQLQKYRTISFGPY